MSSITANKLGFLYTVILFGILTALNQIQAAIRCSRCDSLRDNYYGECEQFPPRPTPCPENNGNMYCSIVRETDFNGLQLLFSRDCVKTHLEEKCIVRNHTDYRLKTVCFRTCDTNGCNSEKLKARGSANFAKVSPFLIIAMPIYCSFVKVNEYFNA